MRHHALVWIASASLAIAVSAAAQDHPDFSGRWVLVSSAVADASAARSLNIRQPVEVTNALGAPMAPYSLELIVEREFVDRVTTETHKIGVEGGIVGGVAEEWEWDSAGILVVTVTDRASDAAPKSNSFTYRRN